MSVQAMMARMASQQASRLFRTTDYDPELNANVTRYVGRKEAMTGGFAPRTTKDINQITAANNSLELGTSILENLERPEFAAVTGPIFGRGNTIASMAGVGHRTARFLESEIKGLAALQPAIHGFRAIRFARDIEDHLLQTEQSPRALAAAIQGLLQASRAVGDVDLYSYMPEDFQQYAGAFESQPSEAQQKLDALQQLGLTPEQIVELLAAGGQ
jgi:hypothetical protein